MIEGRDLHHLHNDLLDGKISWIRQMTGAEFEGAAPGAIAVRLIRIDKGRAP